MQRQQSRTNTMKFSQLRSFHAVARTGSFSTAAEQLHISQPTITAQIKELENHYKVQLLRRKRGNNQLTDTGIALYQQTQMIFALERKAKEILQSEGDLLRGTLKIGAVSPKISVPVAKAFNQRYPGIKLIVETGGSEHVRQKVMSGELDVGMIAYSGEDERLVSYRFSQQSIILAAPVDHPLAAFDSISLRQLEGVAIIDREPGSTTRKIFDKEIQRLHIRPKVIMEIASREGIREAAASGIGIAYVGEQEFQPHPNLKPIAISDLTELSYAYVICAAAQQEVPMTKAFLSVAEEVAN